MAFTSTITETSVFGNKRVAYGTFTNTSGSTGGDIDTGLNRVDIMHLQTTGSPAPASSSPSINETFPLASAIASAVTIVTVADAVGVWIAYGA